MTPNDDRLRSSKRRKVAESCKSCRAKKTRCDGQRPTCSPCGAREITCEYNDATLSVPAGQMANIEARLSKLEQSGAFLLQASSDAPTAPSEQRFHARPMASRQQDSNPDTRDQDVGSSRPITEYATSDFMKVMGQHTVSPSDPSGLLYDGNYGIASMVIPKKAVADDLLECYDTFVYPHFPVIHLPTLHASYRLFWDQNIVAHQENSKEQATFHATLNMVFALGCLNNSKIESHLKLQTAFTFYGRAQTILPLHELDYPSLSVVQYLLLTSIYLSYTKYSNRCCNTLAVAIRVAQTLGLHMDIAAASTNQLKREMSRRVWHHCVLLDRLFASTFGRKIILISNNIVPIPGTIDDEYLLTDGMGAQPPDLPSLLDAFEASVKLFEIMQEASELEYDRYIDGIYLHQLSQILGVNEKIDKLEQNLPAHLKMGYALGTDTARSRLLSLQTDVLNIRIVHLRLQLLRPNVVATARQSLLPNALLNRSVARSKLDAEISSISVQTATSAINILHNNSRSSSRIISSGAVFVTLSAATIIIAAALVPDLDITLDTGSPYKQTIELALQVLEEHRWQIEGVTVAKQQLEKLVEIVDQVKKGREGISLSIRQRYTERKLVNVSDQTFNSSPLLNTEDSTSIPVDLFDDMNFRNSYWNFEWNETNALLNVSGPCLDYFSWDCSDIGAGLV